MESKIIKWTLHQNVVSDDYVEIAPQGYRFKNGIKYILHYYTYATECTDSENIKNFRCIDSLNKFYSKSLKRGDIFEDYSIECAELE